MRVERSRIVNERFKTTIEDAETVKKQGRGYERVRLRDSENRKD